MSYQDSKNKQTIRRVWNAHLLDDRRAELGRPLSYFGLPGPEIHDLLDWRHLLGQRTAVEWLGRTAAERVQAQETIGRLLMNVGVHEIGSEFQLLRGDVETVILDGADADGQIPVLADDEPEHRRRFGYDVVNLDFLGGIGYRNQHGPARRVAAIRKLFERQRGHDFVFLLTVNVRHKLGDEIEEFLEGMAGRDTRGEAALDWFRSRPAGASAHKLKATVPCFVRASAEPHQFQCTAFPPVLYEGHEGAWMVHFMFDLRAGAGSLGAFSRQGDGELIDLPLVECVDGMLALATEQHPGFSEERCEQSVDFLPLDVRAELLSAPRRTTKTKTPSSRARRGHG